VKSVSQRRRNRVVPRIPPRNTACLATAKSSSAPQIAHSAETEPRSLRRHPESPAEADHPCSGTAPAALPRQLLSEAPFRCLPPAEARCHTLWTHRAHNRSRVTPLGLTLSLSLAVHLTRGQMPINRSASSHRCLSTEREAEASHTIIRPCRTPDCQGADQAGACAIASVSEPPTSGRYSTDESVVPVPVSRYRHPILPWALYPSEVRRRRRRSNPTHLSMRGPLRPSTGSLRREAADSRGVFTSKIAFDQTSGEAPKRLIGCSPVARMSGRPSAGAVPTCRPRTNARFRRKGRDPDFRSTLIPHGAGGFQSYTGLLLYPFYLHFFHLSNPLPFRL